MNLFVDLMMCAILAAITVTLWVLVIALIVSVWKARKK